MINKKILQLVVALNLLTAMMVAGESPPTAIRAAIDIGSGATKLRVVEVDLQKNKVIRIIDSQSYAVPYQEQLSKSKEGNFDETVMKEGIDALKQAAAVAQKYQAEKVIGVATAAFRNAKNANEYINQIYKETGVVVHVIDQNLEGELAFEAVRAQYGFNPKKLIVWDIGGGSLQLTTVNGNGQYEIFRGNDASIPFKNHVISNIQLRDADSINTPNPLSGNQLFRAQFDAIQLAEKVDRVFKDKIPQPEIEVVGVGNIFGYQITKIAQDEVITKDQMIQAVSELVNKSDEDVGGGDYANVYVTNSILVLGIMEGLDIKKMHLADINPADGAFVYSPFWDK